MSCLPTHVFCAGRRVAAGVFVLAAACSSAPRPKLPNAHARAPVLSSSYILAPVQSDAAIELEELQGVPGHAAMLRRAFIHLHTGQPQQANDAAAEVLYSVERPSPAEEAYARYIRAESFAAQGKADRGAYDRTRALELALDPELRRRLEAKAAAAPARGDRAGFALQRRSSWHPAPPVASRMDPMGRVFRVTVHHSAMYFRDQSPQAAAAEIHHIQRQHMSADRNFGDIGYHYLIDPSGRIWEGRDSRWQGAHARGEHNQGNIGICVLGNFIRGSGGQLPTEAQSAALQALLTRLMAEFSIPPEQVKTHRDFVVTECPGALLQSVVDNFVRTAIAERRGHRVAARE